MESPPAGGEQRWDRERHSVLSQGRQNDRRRKAEFQLNGRKMAEANDEDFEQASAADRGGPDEPLASQTSLALPEVPVAAALGRQLIEQGIVLAEDWEAVERRLEASADPLAILHELRHAPASWRTTSGAKCTVLTAYQFAQIATGHTERLRLDRYVLLDRLGVGGMASVFRARELGSRPRLVAVKTIHTGPQPRTAEETQQLQVRLERERRLLCSLRHAGLPRIENADYRAGVAFLAMEYIEGRTLDQFITRATRAGRPIRAEAAIRVVIEVAKVLEYLHEQAVIHRDVKPANIMISKQERIVLLDLGFARPQSLGQATRETLALTRPNTYVGTAELMAPEQWTDPTRVTPAADVYSLGGTLFCLLTGQPPYQGATHLELMTAHMTRPVPSIVEKRPDVPAELDHVIRTMLAKQANDRYQRAGAVITALQEIGIVPKTQATSRPVTLELAPDPWERALCWLVSPLGVFFATVLFGGLLLLAVWLLRGGR